MDSSTENLIHAEIRNDIAVIRFNVNEVRTAEQAMCLRDEMIEFLETSDCRKLVIDFSMIGFMGSIGFLTLMHMKRHPNQPTIALSGLSENLRSAFEACRLIKSERGEGLFHTASSIDDGVAFLAQ